MARQILRGNYQPSVCRATVRCGEVPQWAGWYIPGAVNAVGVPLFEKNGVLNGALGVMLPPQRDLTQDLWQTVIESALSCGKLISYAQGCPVEVYPGKYCTIKEEK